MENEMENEFVFVKGYFNNGYRKWDGILCTDCGRVFDPDKMLGVEDDPTQVVTDENKDSGVCPYCYFVNSTPIEKVVKWEDVYSFCHHAPL